MYERIFSLKIFEGIPQDIVLKIIGSSKIRSFSEGEIVILEGAEPSSEAFIIKNGTVEIIIGNQKIAELGSGDIFGEMGLLNDEPRIATVKATSELEVFVINFECLMELVNHGSEFMNKTILDRIEKNLTI